MNAKEERGGSDCLVAKEKEPPFCSKARVGNQT